MAELERKLLEIWDERPEREKLMFIGLALIIVVWFSWSFVIKGNLKKVWAAHKMLVKVEAEYKEAVEFHKNAAAFKKKQKDLEAELKQKWVEEEEFNQRIRAQGQLEDVMEGLRSEAGKSSLKLVTLDVKTTATAESAPGKADVRGDSRKDSSSYKRNNILLVCRGPYRQTVEYLLKVMDMPRVMSLTSLSMVKPAVSALRGAPESKPDAAGAGDSTLETRLELEVLFK